MKTKFWIALLAIAFSLSIFAQFKMDGQYRIRGQVLHGYKKPVSKGVDPAVHVGQRTRLNLQYKYENITTRLSVQDVRVWGDANVVNPTGVEGKNIGITDIYEAWVQIGLSDKSFLKLGRQEMKYDDQRHISWRNWWDTGQTYDALLFSYNDKETGWRVDISGSFNSKKLDLTGNDYSDGTDYFGPVNPMITQNFVYVKKSIKPNFYVSLLGIAAGYQKEGTKNVIYVTATEGIHINYNATKKNIKDGLWFKGNLFVQNGANIQGKKVKAHMITALLGYRTMNKKLDLSFGLEKLSGNDSENTDPDYVNTDHTYNLLYGARHPYYEGYMDWFVLPKSAFNGGFQTFSFNVQYKASKKDIFKFAYNNVSVANNIQKIINGNPYKVSAGSNLAQFVDLTYIRKCNKIMKLMTGFSYAMPSDDYNKLKGITDPGTNYFFYTMLTLTPKFFETTK